MSIIDYAQNWPTKIKEQLALDLLKDKTVMITGASDGIGAELSKCLGLLGANIILLGKTRHKLEAVFDQIAPNCQGELILTPCDLSRL
jgi:short-subunit dehydrogenase